jgi:hypothetical protein
MPDPYAPCGQATPQTALWPFGGSPLAGRAACGRLLPPCKPLSVRAWTRTFGESLQKTREFPVSCFFAPVIIWILVQFKFDRTFFKKFSENVYSIAENLKKCWNSKHKW